MNHGAMIIDRMLFDRRFEFSTDEVEALTAARGLLQAIAVSDTRTTDGSTCAVSGDVYVGFLMALGFPVPTPSKRMETK